jgi:exportin-2 (importin alpha re-exporter)
MCANKPVFSRGPIHPYIIRQQLVQSISNDDFNINLGVLETAHSIFRSWRSQARSDAFWSIIKLVHSKLLAPYFALFQLTISRLLASPDPLLAQTMAVLVELFYDLTCQDLAPEFEDSHEVFFAAETGYFMQLMEWNPPQLDTDVRFLRAPLCCNRN